MPRKRILSPKESAEFDSFPKFSAVERHHIFEKIFLETNTLDSIKYFSISNKIHYLVTLAYFKRKGGFYLDRSSKDLKYVAKLLSVSEDLIEKHSKQLLSRHKKLILAHLGYVEFSEVVEGNLRVKIWQLLRSQKRHRKIFEMVHEYLRQNKIEVPSSYKLQEIIIKGENRFDNELINAFSNIPRDVTRQLDSLFDEPEEGKDKKQRYKIRKLMEFKNNAKYKTVRHNVAVFKALKSLYDELYPYLMQAGLLNEGISQFAYVFIKSDIYQFTRAKRAKRNLYAACFICFQYRKMQDNLIEVMNTVVGATETRCKNEYKEIVYDLQKDRREIAGTVFDYYQKFDAAIEKIEECLYKQKVSSIQKVDQIKKILSKVSDPRANLSVEVAALQKSFETQEQNYFKSLTRYAKSANNKIEPIIKQLDFSGNNGTDDLVLALESYLKKNGDISNSELYTFLTEREKKRVLNHFKKIANKDLYKFLLFKYVAEGTKSGRVCFKNSIRFKSLEDYLIPEFQWKKEKDELIKIAGLKEIKNLKKLLELLRKDLSSGYHSLNKAIDNNQVEHIKFSPSGRFVLNTPAIQKEEPAISLSLLFPREKYVPLNVVMETVNMATNYLEGFQHKNWKFTKERPENSAYYAALMGLGCHIGVRKISKISKNLKPSQIENVEKWHLTQENLIKANNIIVNYMDSMQLPQVYLNKPDFLHTSSDGSKWGINPLSVFGKYSFKYLGKGKGISINSHIDERGVMYFSSVISVQQRESVSCLDGLLHNENIVSDMHSTDTHGFTEIMFAVADLLGFHFAPRIKGLNRMTLYSFDNPRGKDYKRCKIAPTKKINTKIIEDNWDSILRLLTTLKLNYAPASRIFSRLTSHAKKHPLYLALKEIGRVYKSMFIIEYVGNCELRQMIEKQLNKSENSQKFSRAVSVGNRTDISFGTFQEIEIVEGCKRLIKNAIVCWNYLYLTNLLVKEKSESKRLEIIKAIRSGSVLRWEHVNLIGEFNFQIKKGEMTQIKQLAEITGIKLDKYMEKIRG
jgi:TnpA family transposase